MKRTPACLTIVAFVIGGAIDAGGQGRPLRLFLSPIGLTDPADVLSAALNPAAQTGINPSLVAPPNQATRLYIWARIEPPGTPNSVVHPALSMRARITGAGGGVAGFQFWNYTNGSYGNGAGRWQSLAQFGDASAAHLQASAVTTGAGINNSSTANNNDAQYRRFAPDGVTRIDATLLGWVEFTGMQPGRLLRIFLSRQRDILTPPPDPLPRTYLGWGDEDESPGGEFGETSIPEATILIVPEPAAAALLGFMLLTALRRGSVAQ